MGSCEIVFGTLLSASCKKNGDLRPSVVVVNKSMTIQAIHLPKWREYRRRNKLVDAPSPFAVSLEGHLTHNPYVGSIYHGGRKFKPKREPEKHNPFLPYMLHSPRCTNSSTSAVKSYLWESSMMPFISQLHAIAERKLTCANLCRQSLHSIPIVYYRASCEDQSPYEETICVICLDTYNDGDTLRVLHCGHRFHRKCVDDWLLGYKSDVDTITSCCPTCKRNGQLQTTADDDENTMEMSLPASPSLGGMDIPADIFTSMGSIFNEENTEAYIPCATLEASEYSDSGFPVAPHHTSSMNDSILLPSISEEVLQ